MLQRYVKSFRLGAFLSTSVVFLMFTSLSLAESDTKKQGPPPVPVRVAPVEEKMVSDQISLVGTAEAIAESTVAAEVSGVVAYFPVKEGDFIKKGALLLRLRSTELNLRYKGVVATREKIKANLQNAEKELKRLSKLKEANSIAETQFDNAYFTHQALNQELLAKEAEIDQIEYELKQKKVVAPFSGFVSKEHTQLGEWVSTGGAVVTLLDLGQIKITVDVPERYAVLLSPESPVRVMIKSVSGDYIPGKIYAVLPHGDPNSRTFPVNINLDNSDFKIKSGMEAMVTFNLSTQKNALLIPKDAIVTAGNDRLVFMLADGKVAPVNVKVLGYYDGSVAVAGNLTPGVKVVVRGNERLRPGQGVTVLP
ncbi:MAG: efflux RND transporter periplasmic adaptor subunit [Desulfobacterales bacterium]|nr:MAG: efflux RND transporter periplasmic adaptor subunit [Desulfobacterales bacterium]